jgi:multicomponent Na+:H+ antiporter subunit A
MSPLLGGHAFWNTTLMMVGGFTMLFAAFHSLFRTDLKAILAYSTISALGIMVFLIGLGTPDALMAVALFILVHGIYKGALFLVTGAVDHATGSRDVTRLAGLGKMMWPVAVAGILAAASNAGFIPTIGFVGKDVIYEATLQFGDTGVWLTGLVVVTNVMLLAAGVVAGIKPFAGKLPNAYEKVSLPHPLLWVPPLLLGVFGLIIGIAPGIIDGPLIQPVLNALQVKTATAPLKLWHGFNTVLMLSLLTIGLGLALYFLMKPSTVREAQMAKWDYLSPEQLTVKFSSFLRMFATLYTNFFQSGYLRRYVRMIVMFLTIVVGIQILNNLPFPIVLKKVLELTFYEVAILGIMLLGTFFAVFTPTRLGAVAAMGVVGYSICLLFVFYSAPDLAMTQFTIDTLTVILFVLVLYKLPKYLKYTSRAQRIRDWVVALMFGTMITMIALAVLAEPGEKEVGNYYAANAYVKAKGKNIVNVILVDFRGLDTMVEITVLSIAALGVFGLMKLRMRDK